MIAIDAMGLRCALGAGCRQAADALCSLEAPGMYPDTGLLQDGSAACAGHDPGIEPALDRYCDEVFSRLPGQGSRNNRLLLCTLAQIREEVEEAVRRCGRDRVAVVMGTSTSGQDEGDRFISAGEAGRPSPGFDYAMQELGSPSLFLARHLGLEGPAYTISTACSSSSKAVISAMSLISAGLADAAIAGGCDTLNRMTANGFNSMGLVSRERCMPFCRDRCGINIGEAAGLVLISRRDPADVPPGGLCVAGAGQASDAWHISSPHPEGAGARRAIAQALESAGLAASDIGYISLHGTATRANDEVEAKVVADMLPGTPCSSTKYLTGHTLGAAGICSFILSALILRDDLELPPQDFSRSPRDGAIAPCSLVEGRGMRLAKEFVLSNSLAFGGSNAVLIAGRAGE